MLRFEADKKMLVLRVNNYNQFNFIDEHTKTMDKYGYVWMLKIGRPLAQKSIDQVEHDGNLLLIKEPKISGNRYYGSKIEEIHQGNFTSTMIFPDYYHALEESGLSLTGTWLKLSCLIPINDADLNCFELCSSHKKMTEIVNATRSPILFVETIHAMEAQDGKMRVIN